MTVPHETIAHLSKAEAVLAAGCAGGVASSAIWEWRHRDAGHQGAEPGFVNRLGRGETHGTNGTPVIAALHRSATRPAAHTRGER